MRKEIAISVVVLLLSAASCFAADPPLRPYNTLIISRFTTDAELAKAHFPAGYEDVLQKTLFARLLSERVFSDVVDASTQGIPGDYSPSQYPVVLYGEVAEFDPGNRAARVAIGYGAGSAKIKIILSFRDMQTNREVLRLEQTGRYAGFGNLTGGSADKAQTESARKVIDGLMKKIKSAR